MRLKRALLSAVVLALSSACQHAGVGAGKLHLAPGAPPAASAEFTWHSALDAGSGELCATLPGLEVYTGPFHQIRARTETDSLGLHFAGWSMPPWAHDAWYGGPPARMAGVNSEKVVAWLKSQSGRDMRCKFSLREPDSGMAGGALGECQLWDRRTIDPAELSRSRR
jgi:hypothetical protein